MIERFAILTGIEFGDVVEHGDGTLGQRLGSNISTGVVLDTETKGDVFQGDSSWRRGEFPS